MKLALKVLLFTLLLPGTFSVYIPNWLLRPEGLAKMLQASGVSLLGWPLLVAGATLYFNVHGTSPSPAEERPRRSIRRRSSWSGGYIATREIPCILVFCRSLLRRQFSAGVRGSRFTRCSYGS